MSQAASKHTLPELLALSDSELRALFYRAQGCTASPYYDRFWPWTVTDANGEPLSEKGAVSEVEAWRDVPPVSAETWLAEFEKIIKDGHEFFSDIDGTRFTHRDSKFRAPDDPLAEFVGSDIRTPSEALKRAVLIASIYLHEQKRNSMKKPEHHYYAMLETPGARNGREIQFFADMHLSSAEYFIGEYFGPVRVFGMISNGKVYGGEILEPFEAKAWPVYYFTDEFCTQWIDSQPQSYDYNKRWRGNINA